MERLLRVFIFVCLLMGLYDFAACSRQSFSASPDSGCGTNCIFQNGEPTYNYSYTTSSLKTDLLFVVDNSASMYSLQQQLGQKFPTLFNAIQNLDYHIGIINTDISGPSNPQRDTIDGYPYTQDGNFIQFPDGSTFLSTMSQNPQSQFEQTIARPETLACQQYINANCSATIGCTDANAYYNACPSENTRAITAAGMALNNNSNGFFRDASVPLNIVIISNSDEDDSGGQLSYQPLDNSDQPSTLISDVQQQYPGKQLKVHSIVIEPGDSSCYNAQHLSSTEFGWFGQMYTDLTQQTGGAEGSVCASNYSPTLTNIATNLGADDGSRDLPCTPVGGIQVTLPNGINDSYTVTTSGNSPRLLFQSPLPPNTTVTLQFQCSP